ncbi:MAG: PCRF domain-containing protein, partial [Chloroflexi bacterium]|nr:PCRF domain-containing protein [Chloroflexota bacterium]
LDDFEKAHPLVQARFLALCDDRQFINAMGEPVDLHNVLFVFASNVTPDQPGGFLVSTEEGERFIAQVQRHAESLLSSATLRCVDDICPFQPLRRGDGRGIAFRQVREFLARVGLPSSRIEVEIEDEVIELALEQGYSVQQGARMLGQQIENLLGMPVRQALAARPSTSDNLLRLYVRQGQVEAAFAPLDDAALTSQAELDHWTLDHVQATIPALEGRIATLEERDQVDEAQSRVDDLLRILGRSDFWEDEGTASQQLAELERLSRRVERARALRRLLGEVKSLAAEAQGGRDRELVWQALRAYAGLEHDLDAAELESCLTGPWDHRDAILLIRPEGESPAGPAWALDMARVILDWTRLHQVDGLEALVWDETRGANGPQSIVIQVRGEGAFGLLKGETGTHRLAQSRQDGATRVREVLHARVTVLPAWSDDELVTVPPQECFVQGRPLRASGELLPRLRSQVVAVHQPSETELTFTSDLAQAEAESRALWLLRAMLTAREAGLLAPESQPVWGTVVRTYDQYRTNQVRDHRTGHVVQDMRRVLEGHIDEFLQAYLRQQANLASQTP